MTIFKFNFTEYDDGIEIDTNEVFVAAKNSLEAWKKLHISHHDGQQSTRVLLDDKTLLVKSVEYENEDTGNKELYRICENATLLVIGLDEELDLNEQNLSTQVVNEANGVAVVFISGGVAQDMYPEDKIVIVDYDVQEDDYCPYCCDNTIDLENQEDGERKCSECDIDWNMDQASIAAEIQQQESKRMSDEQ